MRETAGIAPEGSESPGDNQTPPSAARHWAAHTGELRRALAESVPAERLRQLHRLRPALHFAIASLLALQAGLLGWALAFVENPLFWLPLSFLLGLTLFDFTVLLHEVVHRLVAAGRRERTHAALGWLYALPSGISQSQFTRWHLDHHAELGTEEADPKRHWLSPKRNARWFKLLYFTPALIPIYFRAAAREAARYEPPLRARIRRERLAAVALHALAAAGLWWGLGGYAALRIYFVPYLLGFPAAFALNRLGQHYDVEASDPARWGTRMRRSLFWDWAFLFSAYHLEHHYFPGVPLYNLRRLNRALEPFFEARGVPARSYGWLLWQWLGRNRAPHTRWA